MSGDELDALRTQWLGLWPQALAAWGRFTRLHPPHLHGPGEQPAGVGSFAWFSCTEVEVHIDLGEVVALGLQDHGLALLAHEVGHHVLAPADLAGSARMLTRVRAGLVGVEDRAPVVSNLWSDLLINDRLQRRAGIAMDAVWRAIGPPDPRDRLMQLVMRTDELLWSLPRHTLCASARDLPETEAQVCARLVRAYAGDPVAGAGGFAVLVRELLAGEPGEPLRGASVVVCGQAPERGGSTPGLAADDALAALPRHPVFDPRVMGEAVLPDPSEVPPEAEPRPPGTGQAFSPADHAAVLAALGVTSDPVEAAVRWYRDRAARHLVPLPVRRGPAATEPLLGALEPWDPAEDLADVDWAGTVLRSPVVVPGVTTVQRTYDDSPGQEGRDRPLDLDLYLDSSGSMPDPGTVASPLALAGAVLALSALRAGARVQATTWSGPHQLAGTDGFTRDPVAVLRACVAWFGGSTSFPLPLLARTHLGAARRDRPCHVAVISDDGIDSMFGYGQPAGLADVAVRAVRAAGGGGSLVLRVREEQLARLAPQADGYDLYRVQEWEDLVAFASDFARRTWALSRNQPRARP